MSDSWRERCSSVLGSAPTQRSIEHLLGELPHIDESELEPWAAETARGAEPTEPADLVRIAGLIDATSLHATDTSESVEQLVAAAVRPFPSLPDAHTAAVCVYPDMVPAARAALDAETADVLLASVAGAFPHGRAPLGLRVAEVEYAVAAGADEVDVVIDRGALIAGELSVVFDQLQALRTATVRSDGSSAALKVILETGELPSYDTMLAGAVVALLAGADFLKTSTGKDAPGASLPAVAVLLQAAVRWFELTGHRPGVKVSGGVRTIADAASYVRLAEAMLGHHDVTPQSFRIGASGLLSSLAVALDGGPAA